MASREEQILETMQDLTNYELWISSGIGCSICNPYYHSKFDSMGEDGLYFDDQTYCKNFFTNSSNYLNNNRNMRFLQHNINIILKYLRDQPDVEKFATLRNQTDFRKDLPMVLDLKEWENARNLWRFGIKFGIEFSKDQLMTFNSKVDNCIDEISNKNFPSECRDFCLKSNPTNKLTIAEKRFVINLLVSEYIVDLYWDTNFPGKYTDSVVPFINETVKTNIEDLTNPTPTRDTLKESSSKKKIRKNAGKRLVRKKEVSFGEDGILLNKTNFVNKIVKFYDQMNDFSIVSLFRSRKIDAEPSEKFHYIDFENLKTEPSTFKAAWLPFPNCMDYSAVRITYDDAGQSILKVVHMLFTFWLVFWI